MKTLKRIGEILLANPDYVFEYTPGWGFCHADDLPPGYCGGAWQACKLEAWADATATYTGRVISPLAAFLERYNDEDWPNDNIEELARREGLFLPAASQ